MSIFTDPNYNLGDGIGPGYQDPRWESPDYTGGSGGGYGSLGFGGGQVNPYLGQMADALTNKVNQNLTRSMLPGIRSNSVAAGGYGGSRQGVVEANAMNDANQGLSNAIAGMYYNAYNDDANRALQAQQLQMNYDLGMTNAGNNFYTQQRGQDLSQMQLAGSMFGAGANGMLGAGQGMYGIGSTYQQAPWQTLGNASDVASKFTGFGSATTEGGSSTGANMLGGALMGVQLSKFF